MDSVEKAFIKKAYSVSEWLKEWHGSKELAIKSGKICEAFNLQKEGLRKIVNFLRSSGIPICSGKRGYWYSENPEDIRETLLHLEGRVQGINRAIKGLKVIQENTGEIES